MYEKITRGHKVILVTGRCSAVTRTRTRDAPGTDARKRIAISRKPRHRGEASASSTREELEPDSLRSTRRSSCTDPDGDELEVEHDLAGRRKVVSSMS